jgi:hypothetical protein
MGDCNTIIDGNYNLHVKKDINLTVDGKIKAKINGGGFVGDIVGDIGVNISGNVITLVHGNTTEKIMGVKNMTIGDGFKTVVSGDCTSMITGNNVQVCSGKSVMASSGDCTLSSGSALNIAAASNLTVHAPANMQLQAGNLLVQDNVSVIGTVVSDSDVISQNISLTYHVHKETGTITLPPTV